MAAALEMPALADALAGVEIDGDFNELTVVAANNYVRGQVIGRGGMGHIVRAHDRRLGRAVAIKELIDVRLRARFEREARLTAKLQHPAIVTVYEAGRWPSGEPFYAMKYVAGRPLDQVIDGMPTLEERLGLLANLTTVVEAIAYAHSERVVHRDLKPQNILLGPFGETVVIDWGLAKDLGEPADAATPFRRAGGDFTAAGAGTPAYMAPEQARGEKPDERVDVYALGATLHHVLAGERPGVGELPPATPRDLRAIVEKAMAPNKDDRYRTAAELAGELRRFQSGQLVASYRYTSAERLARWLRRHRSLAFVVAAAVVGLAVTGTVSVRRIVAERDRANQLAAIAESERLGAERLVDYMLGTMRERLAGIGKLDLLAGLGKEVRAYYAGSRAASELNVGVLERRARALDVLSDVDREKEGDDLRADTEGTLLLCNRLWALAPTPWAAGCVIHANVRLGNLARSAPTMTEAFARYDAASRQVEQALLLYPDEGPLRRARGLIALNRGHAYYRTGDLAAATRSYQEGVAAIEPVVAANPEDKLGLGNLTTLRTRLGDLAAETGFPDAALPHYEAALALADRLRRLEPDVAEWQHEWAVTAASVAQAAIYLGRFDLARDRIAAAQPVMAALVAAEPTHVRWASDQSFVEGCACEVAFHAGRLADADALCSGAAEINRKILEQRPKNDVAAGNLTIVETRLAAVARLDKHAGAARAAAERAVQRALATAKKRAGSAIYLRELADAEAELAADGGGANAAAIAFAAVVALPDDDAESVVARLHAELGLAGFTGDASLVRDAAARADRASRRWPSVVPLQGERARALLMLAGRSEGAAAEELRAQASAIVEPLEKRGALDPELREELGLR